MDDFLEEVPMIEIDKMQSHVGTDMPEEHIHSYYELYFLLSGERRYFIGGEIYNVAPGNLIIIPPNVIHRTVSYRQKGYDRYVLYFSEMSIRELRAEFGEEAFSRFFAPGCLQFPYEEIAHIREIFERLFSEQKRNATFRYSMMRSLLCEIVVAALRHGTRKGCAAGEGADKIQLVAGYISENFAEPLTLAEAARMACMEKTYFSKRFKALTGFNFSTYLTQVRLRAAQGLLLTTTKNISEVAALCGFSGSNYFGDAFSRLFGMSPSEYRRHMLAENNAKKAKSN